ncbi:hypothetical protein BTO06_07960 [Tenacibaculum sp. SZ-18]|uniref:DUF72 domain-containing protein n=1 Tax=Tenacibaculum sp. SZ-18 TaxID=754423 RepID=UPI000C2D36B3|nr:DUF72 domain-containing protein [Tenacibaculum sp. SZ-18]AUC15073.1 hypothetical protein BTO06_07960 [Tenacibaculum sp. SZ-18]
MKFGKVEQPELVDFSFPETNKRTTKLLSTLDKKKPLSVYVGCTKWNKADLKGFYPRGTKDELVYYSSQFNSIELNATFYRQFPPEQFEKWKNKTPDGFKFFPKLTQEISHWNRLKGVSDLVNYYLDAATRLEKKLGTIFLQLHSNFGPKNFDRLKNFVEGWPKDIPLSVECRHTNWFTDETVAFEFYELLESNGVSNTIVDTAGRRDMMHMRLTNNEAFIRFVGANHSLDYARLDDWVERLSEWVNLGLRNIHFFVHQSLEIGSPLLASYFIKKINSALDVNLKIPKEEEQQTLF